MEVVNVSEVKQLLALCHTTVRTWWIWHAQISFI